VIWDHEAAGSNPVAPTMIKFCVKCNQNKNFDDFNKNKRRTDGLQTYCRLCQMKYDNNYYHTSTNRRLQTSKRRLKNKKITKNEINAYKRKNGCKFCDEKDACCLDFHHVNNKKNNVSALVGCGLNRVWEEIKKCILVCANCHRKIHAGNINCSVA
jgi:hypothetical protein